MATKLSIDKLQKQAEKFEQAAQEARHKTAEVAECKERKQAEKEAREQKKKDENSCKMCNILFNLPTGHESIKLQVCHLHERRKGCIIVCPIYYQSYSACRYIRHCCERCVSTRSVKDH